MSPQWNSQRSFALAVLALVAISPESAASADDGDLDLAFGTNGIVSTPINSHAVAVQGDGRIVVVGDINGDFGVVRYNLDGSLDGTFGQGGIVQTDLGGNDSAHAVALWADGRILVGGTGLVRYNPNGSLDTTFGSGGLVASVPVEAVAIRPGGADAPIIAVGSGTLSHVNNQGDIEFTSVLPPIIPCVNPLIFCGYASPTIRAYDILPSGQIVVAGSILTPGGYVFFIGRYRENGTPDTSFGTNGGIGDWIAYEYDVAAAVAVKNNGEIVAAGLSYLVQYPPLHWYTSFALGRYNNDGMVAGGGPIRVPDCLPSTLCLSSAATALALQLDGKIVVAGTSERTLSGGGVNLALVRLQPNGEPDPSFGTAGIVITDVSPVRPTPLDVTIQRDGNILVAAGGILARYLGTSTEDVEPPVIDCDEPDDLWHPTNVTLTCEATDSGSGLANAEDDAHFTLRTNVAVEDEWPNAFTDSRQICDNSGHCATAGPIGGNMIDLRPPTVVVTVPAAGSTFTLGQPIDADYACHDAGSGIQSCSGTVPGGVPVNVSSVGLHTFEVTSVDAVGNSAHATSAYTVSYGICPLYDTLRNSGSTLPIKLQLCNASGANVSSPAIVVTALRIVPLSIEGGGSVDDAGHAHSGLEFRFSGGQYILNLSLRAFAPGTYGLQFKAGNDPTIHTVQFEVSSRRDR